MSAEQQAALNPAALNSVDKQYLTFSLGSEEYGVDILKVREIRSWSAPTPLPHSPAHVLGAINLRGAIIPIVDLRRQFHLERCEFGGTTGIIVVQTFVLGSERFIGMVVDRVLNVSYLALAEADLTIGRDMNIGARYVEGLSRTDNGLVIVVDLEAIIEASLSVQGELPPVTE